RNRSAESAAGGIITSLMLLTSSRGGGIRANRDNSSTLYFSPAPPHVHSFPTRRSSDLGGAEHADEADLGGRARLTADEAAAVDRSEEHTSELQSQSKLVCRLLLEKKTSAKTRPPCSVMMRETIARLNPVPRPRVAQYGW